MLNLKIVHVWKLIVVVLFPLLWENLIRASFFFLGQRLHVYVRKVYASLSALFLFVLDYISHQITSIRQSVLSTFIILKH